MNRKQVIEHLRGIFCPVVTPFNRRGDIEEGLFCENLVRYSDLSLSGIVIAGSTGEAPYLEARERLRLLDLARPIVRPPQLLILGTGLESTRETIRLSREAAARGADAVLVITPAYYKSRMDSKALTDHFRAVASSVRRPVIVYHIPQFTGIRMEPKAVGALSRHPNIIALKESSGDLNFVRAIIRNSRGGFPVLVGSPAILLDALSSGAAGGVLGMSGFVPELCLGIYEAFRLRRLAVARDLQERLLKLVAKIGVPYGIPGVKAAVEECGYAGGFPRSPLAALTSKQKREVAAALRDARAGLEL
ncbi:MAG TPA: dihydrodipicolinate synthase family protein [Terriglobia bacterium]|jgi:4-hydroxy-2-oxoglutarate aldolase|nr:dihydrodipicolinate synthase family protein [Terriglobia bacterium]